MIFFEFTKMKIPYIFNQSIKPMIRLKDILAKNGLPQRFHNKKLFLSYHHMFFYETYQCIDPNFLKKKTYP